MSLAHAVLNQRKKARRAMRIAVSIEPNHRVVVRAAIRLLVHLGRSDEAFEFLRRHPRTQVDPWLLSQDVSVAQILGRVPYFLGTSRRLLRDSALPPGPLTELASAVGTLDGGAASLTRSRKLHRFSLIAPTDNVLAQVEWLRQKDSALPRGTASAMRSATEAQFWSSLSSGTWEPALEAVFKWQNDEAYSTRPALAGSFLASSILGDAELGGAFAEVGLRADPSDALLTNNLVVARARTNMLPEATQLFNKIQPNERLPTYVYHATRGLLKYAMGDEAAGAEDYRRAVQLANDVRAISLLEASCLDTQARWGTVIDKYLLDRTITSSEKATDQVVRGAALCALAFVASRQKSGQRAVQARVKS